MNRLNISSVWCPIYDINQNYQNTTNIIDSNWSVSNLARAIFQENLAIVFGPMGQAQQTNLGNKTTVDSMKYKYDSTYLLSNLDNYITPIPVNNSNPPTISFRIGDDSQSKLLSLGVSNILIFNKKLSIDEINYLSTFSQLEINNLFPKNN